jgi:hypothetical protein
VASVSFPSAYANPRSVGDVGEGRLRTINLVRRPGRPPHPLYSAATGAHQPEKRSDAPDQGAREGNRSSRWTRSARMLEIILTFSPLISTLLLPLYFILYLFHHRSVYRACFIVTAQLPIESDSHYTLLCFKTNSVTFGPLMIQKS